MKVDSLLVTAFRAMWRHKTRSFLTMLGVIIGVMAVILLLAIGSGLQNYIAQEFESLGTNSLTISPGEMMSEGGGFQMGAQFSQVMSSRLSMADVKAVRRLRQYVTAVIPEFLASARVSYKENEENNVSIYGTSADIAKQGGISIGEGSYFSEADVEAKKRVVVLGSQIAQDLFGGLRPVGKRILIDGVPFLVEGVLADSGGLIGAQVENFIIMPITVAHDVFDSEQIMSIDIKLTSKDVIPQAQKAIEETLLKRLDEDEFSVVDQAQILGTINNILGLLSVGLSGIAAISLLVGGIGIMNIMLVSVTERTREIGLRKALGATPALILWQFLIESSVLSVTGGFIGVMIAYGITLVMQQFFPAHVTLWSVLLAFIVSVVIGVLFGVLPARKASKLSPIEALRYE